MTRHINRCAILEVDAELIADLRNTNRVQTADLIVQMHDALSGLLAYPSVAAAISGQPIETSARAAVANARGDTVSRTTGTFACPICGDGTPHSHSDAELEVKRPRPTLHYRLGELARTVRDQGFYTAMCRIYSTDYSWKAEAALANDLVNILAGKSA